MSLIGDFFEFLRWRSERKTKQAEEGQTALAERVLAEMRRAQVRHPAPLLFHVERLTVLLGVQASTLVPALNRLVHEGQIFQDPRSGLYTLEPTPWNRPGGHRLFG